MQEYVSSQKYAATINIQVIEEDYLHMIQFTNENNGNEISGDITIKHHNTTENGIWVPTKEATCGLILSGIPQNSSNKQPAALYAVFPAHLPLDDSDCRKLIQMEPLPTSELDRTVGQLPLSRYSLHVHNSDLVLDLVETPKIDYGHYFTNEGTKDAPQKRFMKDIAILKLDQRPELLESLKYAMSKKRLYSGHEETEYDIGEILPIHDPRILFNLHQRKIDVKVGSINGHLICARNPNWTRPFPERLTVLKSFCVEFKTINQ